MFAIIAVVLFLIALLLDLFGGDLGPVFDISTLTLAGFLCIALHLAGAGSWHTRFGGYRRRRR
ncbi:hypothetical protein KZZ52_10540 [Dactylosporangium sp. AC04546]|uniref:hypothetical protein n=1 Tax=Dactylosporangium sp. AC04546 TaxID=2862460 RepID=UPI001EDD81AD|nr:hypothetical protein [Dactylosporangium sp. AC04546]WVK85794.1 hypothetical protein KZZ52_10540 [Dactylosporangium sp. AC04546]